MPRWITARYVVPCALLSFIAFGCSSTADDMEPSPSGGSSSAGGARNPGAGGREDSVGGRNGAGGRNGESGGASAGGDPEAASGGTRPSGGGPSSGGGSDTGGDPGTESGGSCGKVDACGVCDGDGSTCNCTDELCQALVFEHNAIRTAVNEGDYYEQPQAEPPIPLVVWDPLIAAKAQEYADSMDDWSQGHSSAEFRTYKSTYQDGYHGENMAIGGGKYADPSYFVAEGWGASEAQGCLLADCGGHYTQIVWRETIAIGCGRKEGVTFEGNVGTLTVCEYGPGGNINGRAPY